MNVVRKVWESVVYMGMQPAPAAPRNRISRLFGPIRRPLERFLAGGPAPSDPLYLTNRTLGQKIRTAAAVAIPCLILVGLVALGAGRFIRVREKPVRDLTTAELKEKVLPNLAHDVQIETNGDLEVAEARVEHGPPVALVGSVKNNTAHAIENAQVVFDLAALNGARLGAVAATIAHVDAKSTAPFRIAVEQDNAAFAVVREVVLP
jgi:hypothetical protein